jgi:hypothetical protein
MQINCTQCGGSVEVSQGMHFFTCTYCESALYLDRNGTVFHFVVSPTVSLIDAEGKLKRWMAGNETAKDLDKYAVIQTKELVYFPLWRFVANTGKGAAEYTELASSFAIPEIKKIAVSGGGMKFFSSKEFSHIPLREPEVLLDSAIHWLENRGVRRDQIKEKNLIHVPFHVFHYKFQNEGYQVVVDATTGTVLASRYPARAEKPFLLITAAAAIIFFLEGLIAPNFLIRLVLYLFTAVPMAIAAYVFIRKY